MRRALTLADIFQIALEAEETGQLFYEAMGETCNSIRVSELCDRMVAQEKDHYQRCEKLRRQYVTQEEERFCTSEQIQRIINRRIMPDAQQVKEVIARGDLAKALDMAIRMEEDAIELYTELKPLLLDEDGRAVDEIIQQEEQHAADLRADRLLLR